ncbi:protein-tyrosine phosphatase family protein [Solicola sp. PLA-1-18]|uniref:protein-tyrosine phosphatase family protein n=1 Tax=Solicola sp. PLA-1-18 TaxID=3380532 RepID=UPI003B7A92C8
MTWRPGSDEGALALPSGRVVRGRSLRRPVPGGHRPEHGLYLGWTRPPAVPWSHRWVRWPDFWVPLDAADARVALTEAWTRSAHERVEVACPGGRGRTGTALACLAVLDGLGPDDAVALVRDGHDPRAVETPGQRRWVHRFAAGRV